MAFSVYPARMRLKPITHSVNVSVRLPGSKSITNRALLIAALAEGETTLLDPLHSEDTFYMAEALRALGVEIEQAASGDFIAQGAAGAFHATEQNLFAGNSGTTIRFLTAASCLTPADSEVVLDGVARMRERPIRDLLGALLTLGVDATAINGHGCPPVRVRGGGMVGGSCRLRGDVSSQFLSALLLTAPYARSDVEIEIVGDLISKPYIDITQSVMREFGVEMRNDGFKRLSVKAGQRYQARNYTIEADASNSSYFLAASAITNGTVTLENLSPDSIQGDAHFIDVLETMGCDVTRSPRQITLRGPKVLHGITVDLEAMPDVAQTLAVVAAFADSSTRINGLASLRVKETDRLEAVACELPKLGVGVEQGRDYWVITPPAERNWRGDLIKTYDDHRMAMSFAVAGLRIPGVVIDDPGCVAKTFPDFWQRWNDAFGPGVAHE